MCWIGFDSRYCKCPFHQSCITSWASWLVLLLLCPQNHAGKSLCNLRTLKPCHINIAHVSYNSWCIFSFQTSFIPPNMIYILFKPLLLWKIMSELTRKPHNSSSYYNCDTRLPFTILITIIPHELLERKILMALLMVWLLHGFSKKKPRSRCLTILFSSALTSTVHPPCDQHNTMNVTLLSHHLSLMPKSLMHILHYSHEQQTLSLHLSITIKLTN